MATIGLDKLYYAKITEDAFGNETYGTPKHMAKAMQAERDSLAKSGDSSRPRLNPDSFRKRAEATDAKIKAILTEEQVAAYEKLQKERGNRQGGNGGRGRRN